MTLHVIYVTAIVILLFGATIFVHELGHFIAARLLGMTAEVFSIGFGPAIWKKKVGDVTYQVACIPVGGYVALPQMDPALGPSKKEPSQESARENGAAAGRADFPKAPPWKKILVSVAGSAGNVVFAVLLAWVVYFAGKPSTPAERCAVIGFVEPDSPAYAEGVRIGDEIIAVNGRLVSNWSEVLQANSMFDRVELTLRRNEETVTVCLPTVRNVIGIRTVEGLNEVSICKVESVDPGSSAEAAGIAGGDIVKGLDGIDVLSVKHLIALISVRPDMEVEIMLDRGGRPVRSFVTPRMRSELGRAVIGIRFDPMAFDYDRKVHIRPGVQLRSHATAILRVVRSLVTPREAKATSEGLGGPFIIIFMFVEMVQRSLVMALWFTCFLNVNLAILNLLPIPILDGGHIAFSLWELVFRRPLHPKVVLWLSNVFACLLILAFVALSGRDLCRIAKLLQLFQPRSAQHEPADIGPLEREGVSVEQ